MAETVQGPDTPFPWAKTMSWSTLDRRSPDAKVDLWIPDELYVNLRPPVPPIVPVFISASLMIRNTAGVEITLVAPTPCDVHYWEIVDGLGTVVQSEPPEICTDNIVTRPLGAREAFRDHGLIKLNGRLLKDKQRYTVRYLFWGYGAEAAFTARLLL